MSREKGELPIVREFEHIRIPMSQLMDNRHLSEAHKLCCIARVEKEVYKRQFMLDAFFNGSKSIL